MHPTLEPAVATVVPAFFTALLASAVFAPAAADGPRSPPQMPQVELRVLDAGNFDGDGTRLAGIEIRMSEGWKTYWRHPGDSGLPPRFDFSGSSNVADIEVKWPVPEADHDGYGWVIGYPREVIFPVVVTPVDADSAVELVVEADYAICANICIPQEGRDIRRLEGNGADAASVRAYLDRVPATVTTDDPRGGVTSVAVDRASEPAALDIEVRLAGEMAPPLLLVEGPEGWHLSLPQHRGSHGETGHRFRLALDGVPDDAVLEGTALHMTAVGRDFSFEQTVVLD